jgi:predicted  nucleic acid-binding Zn-ribbon protein
MLGKLTREQILEKFKEVHGEKYDYSFFTEYVGAYYKIQINCKEHGIFNQTVYQHINEKGCKKCGYEAMKKSHRKTLDQVLSDFRSVHGNRYSYELVTEYINAHTPVSIICHIHGIYQQMPYRHFNSLHGCPKCGRKQANDATRKPLNKFIEEAINIHGKDTYDYSKVDYINSHRKVEIICKIHNKSFFQIPVNHLSGSKCTDCAIASSIVLRSKTTKQFIIDAKNVHGLNTYVYDKIEYVNKHIKVLIGCTNCDQYYEQAPDKHLEGQGCPRCVYKNESESIEIIENLSEERFKKCKPLFLNGLELDGYCEKLKLALEYNGRQHYEYVDHFHRDGLQSLVYQQERDQRKIRLCHENGIYLIIIPYTIEDKKTFIKNEYDNYLFLRSCADY